MIRDTSLSDRVIEKPRGLSRRNLVWGAVALVLMAGAVFTFPTARRWASADRSVDVSRLRLAMVSQGNLERDISVQGRIVAAVHPTLFSPEEGTVQLLVRAGDTVTSGQDLARVTSPELRSLLKQEEARLHAAQADMERQRLLARQRQLAAQQEIDLLEVKLAAAQRAERRAEESRAAGIINDVEFEKAQDDHRILALELAHSRQKAGLEAEDLEFEIRNRELQVERQRLVAAEIQRQVDQLVVRSPVDGMVSTVDIMEQDMVTQGQPILGVVDLSAYEVEIRVPEAYAGEILPETEAVIRYDGQAYPGLVKTMSPEVEGSQVRGVVVFAGEPPAGLKQNQRVSTRLVLESRDDILKVARGPFLEEGGGRKAYVMDGDLAVLRSIEVGTVSVGEVEILSGLQKGDEIIISDMKRFRGAQSILVRR
jgi:HlyD family secretion protein